MTSAEPRFILPQFGIFSQGLTPTTSSSST